MAGSDPIEKKVDWGPRGWIPDCPDVCVQLVENGTCHHMSTQALGTPLHPERTVLSVRTEMRKMQGELIDGNYNEKVRSAEERISRLCHPDRLPRATLSTTSLIDLEEENRVLKSRLLKKDQQLNKKDEELAVLRDIISRK